MLSFLMWRIAVLDLPQAKSKRSDHITVRVSFGATAYHKGRSDVSGLCAVPDDSFLSRNVPLFKSSEMC